jgi:hypothetical protein
LKPADLTLREQTHGVGELPAAFAELAERNNGVFGGCWCMGYHLEGPEKRMGISHRAAKEDRVRTGRAHAALVIDEDGSAQG